MKSRGFTLLELIVVLAIVGVILSVSLPVSYSMYQSYEASLKAEEVLLFLFSARKDAFLYAEEKSLSSREGRLLLDDTQTREFENVFLQIDTPIKFFRNGTTSGGEVKIYVYDHIFLVGVDAPLGNLSLTRSN
jgi:prepilin-type N-terminal cleavage/methylation domain-containing protein